MDGRTVRERKRGEARVTGGVGCGIACHPVSRHLSHTRRGRDRWQSVLPLAWRVETCLSYRSNWASASSKCSGHSVSPERLNTPFRSRCSGTRSTSGTSSCAPHRSHVSIVCHLRSAVPPNRTGSSAGSHRAPEGRVTRWVVAVCCPGKGMEAADSPQRRSSSGMAAGYAGRSRTPGRRPKKISSAPRSSPG